MRRMTGRLLVLISGLTLLSATFESAYAERGCRGCDIRTAVVINRASSTQTQPRSTTSFQRHQSDQIEQILERYRQEKAKNDWVENTALALGLIVDEVVSEMGGVVSPLLVVPSIVTSGVEITLRFGTAKAMMHLIEKAKESASVVLTDGLKQYGQQHDGNFQGLFDAYDRGEIPGEGVFELLFSGHPVYDTRLDDVRPEDRHVVNKFLIQGLFDIVGRGMEGINDVLRQHAADVDKNWRNLIGLAEAFNRYVDEANKRFERLAINQRKLHDAIFENRKDIEAVQKILFDTLTP